MNVYALTFFFDSGSGTSKFYKFDYDNKKSYGVRLLWFGIAIKKEVMEDEHF